MGESHTETSGEVISLVKPFSADDLSTLSVAQPAAPVLKQIRDHHHRLAWMVAKGMRTGEIAKILGMSISRVSILKSDPAFRQLVEAYRKRCDEIEEEEFRDVTAIRAHNEFLALQEVNDRLEHAPETFSVRDLIDIAADNADRNGNPKLSRTHSTNVSYNLADALAASQRRVLTLSASPPPEHGTQGDVNAGTEPKTPAEGSVPAGEGK